MNGIASLNLLILIFVIGCSGLDIGSVQRIAQQTFQSTRPLSDEEEYYIGRAVAARILSTYSLSVDNTLNEYVNIVGNTVALNSEEPFTYGGYHFAVLESDELNAFASPGGIIFVTSGLINSLKNEDELASVLAHEIAHINHRDGISSIQTSRLTGLATLIGTEAAQVYGPSELSEIVRLFEGSIDDVFKTVVVNGYSRSQELEADEAALIYLSRAGYNPAALEEVHQRFLEHGRASREGIIQTHPGTLDRIEKIKLNLPSFEVDESFIQLRAARFQKAIQ